MTHDEGVHWLAGLLREIVGAADDRARQGYVEAETGLEEEYWRGQRDALDDVLEHLHKLAPRR
jgi:hypothetical protein